ncbi:(d)CMP kinase [Dysgonomonas sp. 216]|uniref:(d)CMP kinase n=1 Tax=Dysgonomonas sp. 216 TaxID=2302934 RepID=UPI0013D81AC1|nr:(d)CMP kinase [Dysgonomonas sp. 216]NDW17898.1 (d)CMP kinase [Dysgonomonas sp. 216]
MKKITIAVDGFSSNGKSTMARGLAKSIGYIYIDSGAMYRAVTLYCIQNNIIDEQEIDINKLEASINNIKIDFKINNTTGLPETYLNGINVEKEIRSMKVSGKVSIVSAIGFVRKRMVKLQQEMGEAKGVVMDGRDIGTVVFPNAELKIFVTATPEIRAQRRLDEMRAKGDNNITFDEVLKNLVERDTLDQNRKEGPLRQAEDAIVLDNTYMTQEEQMEWLLQKYKDVINK